MTPRRRATALATSLLLLFAGVVSLALAPVAAHAEGLSKQTPDFTLKPGDTKTQSFSKTMVGSVEVKGNPDECRKDQVKSFTCDTRRVKLTRAPGYSLRVVLEWGPANPGADAVSVPDVDLLVFEGPTASLDSAQIGGAGQAMPEVAKFVPEQDEYDLVVQAYAGVVQTYKLTLYYTNTAEKQSNVTPDIVLSPNDKPFVKEYQSVLAGETGSPALYPLPAVQWAPADCRTNPAFGPLCDVYRIKLNRNLAKGALNFVVIQLDWEATQLPDLSTPAAGLGLGYLPGLVAFVWDSPDHVMERGAVGGQDDVLPQRLGFTATQDEYDIVVEVAKGAITKYKLTALLTDEVASKPFELLDPVTGQPIGAPASDNGANFGSLLPDNSGSAPPSLDLAPIDTDSQIAGIGLGTTEQFDAEDAIRLGQQALRNTSISSDPPPAALLWLMLVLLPIGALGGGVFVMRRRHNVLF